MMTVMNEKNVYFFYLNYWYTVFFCFIVEIDNVFKEIERRVSSGASGSMGGDENGDDVSSEEGKILFTKNATLSTKDGDVWKV